VDSQSIQTATQGTEVGFEGGKKIKGRKRHILVDTLGLLIRVVVTSAALEERVGLVAVLRAYFADGVQRLRKIWGDGAYRAQWLTLWVRGLKHTHKIDLEVTDHSGPGFQVIPWRWVVVRANQASNLHPTAALVQGRTSNHGESVSPKFQKTYLL